MNREPAPPDDSAATQQPPSGSDFLARLRDLFDAAIEIPRPAREAWIAGHVSDTGERDALMHLLDADDATSGFFETPASDHVAGLAAGISDDLVSPDALIGTRIGAFRLVRLLGKGGMAAVFLGERVGGDFRQLAAVKLLRRGLYSELEQRLFQRERRVLAGLAHPNIAHLIDGGVTDAGIPFLIMEYVDGLPVTRHVAENALDARARIRLFLTICRAVEAAHRSLVVHRDIKPSNILVARDGTVKLLDFGIAKLIEDEVDAPTADAFTPDYAAPEQLAGKPVTTATDVYALGIVLYELLLGVRPGAALSRRPSSLAGTTGESAAAPPQLLRRVLRGDLDNILLRALEAEPERRYTSAGALADDIERHLAGRPVAAHPPSRWYRTRKFMQRHRGGVAITATLVLGILSALGLALWQANVALRQEAAARHEAQRANAVRDFMEKLFEPVSEGVAEDKQPSLSDLVAAGVERLKSTPDLGAAERVDLTMMFARLQANLGEFEQATQLADAADDLAHSTLEPMHEKAIAAVALRGERHVRDGDHVNGEPLLREAKRRIDAVQLHGAILLAVLDNLSVVEMDRDRSDIALDLARQALAERRLSYGENAKEVASGYNNLGYGLVGVGRFDEAAEAYRRAYEIDIRYRQPDSYDVLEGLSNWGWAQARAGHAREARTRLAEVDEGLQKLGGKPRGLHVYNSQKLCIVDVQFSAPAVSERSCRRMLDIAAQLAAAYPRTYAGARMFDAARLLSIGRIAEARALFEEAWVVYPDTPQFTRERSTALALRAEIDWVSGDAAAARRNALAARPLVARVKDSRVGAVRLDGILLLACRRAPADECPEHLEDDFKAGLQEYASSNDVRLLLPRLILARGLIEQGATSEASLSIEQTLQTVRGELGEDHPLIATAHVWRALALDRQGDCAGALRERTAAEAASERMANPWFTEARAAISASAHCPHD